MPPTSFSHRSDPQRTPEGTLPVFTRCGLADGLFEHPAGSSSIFSCSPMRAVEEEASGPFCSGEEPMDRAPASTGTPT